MVHVFEEFRLLQGLKTELAKRLKWELKLHTS